MASRYQNFLGTNQCLNLGIYVPCSTTTTSSLVNTGGDSAILIVHAPSFEISNIEREVAKSHLFVSADLAAEGVSRSEPNLTTSGSVVNNYSIPLLGRYDLQPEASYALFWKGWTFRPDIAVRDTYYTQRALGNISSNNPVNRRSIETSLEFRPPALQKVFDKTLFQHQIKHTIEPRFVYDYVNGIDNFHSIVRFDDRDILSNTNEVMYAITTRLYTKNLRPTSDCPKPLEDTKMPREQVEALKPKSSCGDIASRTREAFRWDLAQKYYIDPTFGGALLYGNRNVFTTSADLTGIAYIYGLRLFSPIVSRMQVQTTANTDIQWNFDYDTVLGRINASTAIANYRFSEYFVGASHAYLNTAIPNATSTTASLVPARFNQIRFLAGFGHPNKTGVSGAASIGFDNTLGFLQYSAEQVSYNWDCCGVSLEYRRFALGNIRNENQYRFSFTLSNIGSFGTMKRQERALLGASFYEFLDPALTNRLMIGAGDKCVKPYKRCLVAALLMVSSAYLLGQHHGSRGTNTPPPTGPAESDDLKDFSRLIALQASPEQVEVFRQAVASIETAKKRVTEFQHPERIAGSDYSRAKAVSDAADDVRLDSGRFLLSFSDAQKSGLEGRRQKSAQGRHGDRQTR